MPFSHFTFGKCRKFESLLMSVISYISNKVLYLALQNYLVVETTCKAKLFIWHA